MRAKKDARKTGTTVVITERDLDILASVHKYEFLTREQLQRLLDWRCTSKVNRRLRKLFDAGFLDRRFMPRLVGSPPAVYILGQQAVEQLGECKGFQADSLRRQRRRAKKMALTNLPHAISVSEFAARMASECESHQECEWVSWIGEHDLAKYCNAGSSFGSRLLIPDGYGRYAIGKHVYNFFLEMDIGTESIARILKKMDFYRELLESGRFQSVFRLKTFRLLFVTGTAGRARSVSSKLTDRSALTTWIGHLDQVLPNPLFGKCWLRSGMEEFTSLHGTDLLADRELK